MATTRDVVRAQKSAHAKSQRRDQPESWEREKRLASLALEVRALRTHGGKPAETVDRAVVYARIWDRFKTHYQRAYSQPYPRLLCDDWDTCARLRSDYGSDLATRLVGRAFREPLMVAFGIADLRWLVTYAPRLAGPMLRGDTRIESAMRETFRQGIAERLAKRKAGAS